MLAVFAFAGPFLPVTAQVQVKPVISVAGQKQAIDLLKFDEAPGTCHAKGRLQDKEYCRSNMMDEIVARGKAAVPLLIQQLTDPRALQNPIFDYWNTMTVGDVAYVILFNLFTDSDRKTFNLPGLVEFNKTFTCDVGAWQCWNDFVRKHGRKFIQDKWSAAWSANQNRAYWDEDARCFRLTK